MNASYATLPPGRSALGLLGSVLIFTALLVGSQVALGGEWTWLTPDDQLVFAAVAILGALAGGLLLRDWRWPLAAGAAVVAFALLALAAIARESGAAGVARAFGSWGVSWPLLVALVALQVASMGALGVFAGLMLAARRAGVPWRTVIPPHLAGLGPAILGAVAYALLLIVALEVWWPWFFSMLGSVAIALLLMAPVIIGSFVRSSWWYVAAPLAVLVTAMVGVSIGGFLLVGALIALVIALLAVVGVRVLGPLVARLDARSRRLAQVAGGVVLVAMLALGLFGWAEQRLGTEPWWPGNAPQGPVSIAWRVPGSDNTSSLGSVQGSYIAPTGYPVIAASTGTVYTLSGGLPTPMTGRMTALEAATGTQRWTVALPTGRTDLFAARPDAVILLGSHVDADAPPAAGSGRWWFDISALAAATGESRWSFRPGGGRFDLVTLNEARGEIVTPCRAEEHSAICAIASDTGAEVWRHLLAPGETAATEIMTLAADDGGVYVVAGDGMATALNAASGEEQWRVRAVAAPEIDAALGRRPWIARLAAGNDAIFLSTEQEAFAPDRPSAFVGSQLIAIDRVTGQVRWELQPGDTGEPRGLSPVATDGEAVYVADSRGTLIALDAASGEERWRFTPEAPVSAGCRREPLYPPLVDGDTIIFSPECLRFLSGRNLGPSTLYGIDAATGRARWTTRVPGHLVGAPVVMNDSVVVATEGDAALLALDLATGEQRWRAGSIGNRVSAPVILGDTVYVATTTAHYGLLGSVSFYGSAIVAFRVAG